MSLRKLAFAISCCFILCPGYSQSVYISPDINIKNDFSYFILAHPDGTTSLLRDKSFKLSYQTLFPDFNWSVEKSIEIPGKKWRILEAFESGNDVGIFFISKPASEYFLYYNIYNSQGIQIHEKKLFEGVVLSGSEGLKLKSSEDKNWMGIIFYNTSDERQLLLYNRKEDSLYYSILLDSLLDSEDLKIREFEISNAGCVYIFSRLNEDGSGKKKIQTQISKIDLAGNKIKNQLLNFGNIAFTNGYAEVDNYNRRIVIAGLYAEKFNQQAKGYAISYVNEDLELLATVSTPFSQELLDEWNGKNKKQAANSGELNTRRLIFTKDGSCLIFYENTKELSRRPYFSSADPTGAYPSRWYDYYFDDIIIASFDNQGNLNWDKVLHKRQYSQDDEGLFSSFFIFPTPALLGIIFNDAISSEGTVSEYLVKPSGDYIRKSLLNTSYKNLNLRFQDAIALNAQCVLVPSENNGKLNLVKIVFD